MKNHTDVLIFHTAICAGASQISPDGRRKFEICVAPSRKRSGMGIRMRIVNLIENTKGTGECLFEHGLSFYVETANHKLLVDAGATNAFMENAHNLGVNLSQVDTLILSHGHYDHAGGILGFVKENPGARILMQQGADGEYYHKSGEIERYIGINPQIMELTQVELIEGNRKIDDEIFLFSGVTGRKLWPLGNKELKVKREGVFYQDEFTHEQYLVLTENGKRILLSGCAHNGILNILEKYREIYKADPDAVISGFHMRKKSGYTGEDMEIIQKIGAELKKTDTVYYTGHCTGEVPYQALKEILGSQIVYVHSGDTIKL